MLCAICIAKVGGCDDGIYIYDGGFPGRAEGFLGCFSAHDIPTRGLMGGNKPVGVLRVSCMEAGNVAKVAPLLRFGGLTICWKI